MPANIALALSLAGLLLAGGPMQAFMKCEDYPEGHPVRQGAYCQSQLPSKQGEGILSDLINLPNTIAKDAAEAVRGKPGEAAEAKAEQAAEPDDGNAVAAEQAEAQPVDAEGAEAERRRLEELRREIERERRALEEERRRAGETQQQAEESRRVLEEARRLVEKVKRKAAEEAVRRMAPGKAFRELLSSGGEGPQMMVLSAGSFRMGCLSDDDDCDDNEKPAHEVRIAHHFAVSVYEVTFEEYDRFARASGTNIPDDGGWGRRPVISVSWEDAKRYAAWLSAQTGAEYRLLSEAEWEYAARAGSTTKYSWGDEIGSNRANCDGCGSRWDNKQTAPAGSFEPNAFGLYDMHGNATEWVADCWNDGYEGAPFDGSAWMRGDCGKRVSRGGLWYAGPRFLRSANRSPLFTVVLGFDVGIRTCVGFRVARTLTP